MPSFTTFLKAALLAFSIAANAQGTPGTLGFALGIHKINDETCKTTEDFVADLKLIKEKTGSSVVRIYTTSQCEAFKTLMPALKETGSTAVVGLWATPPDHFLKEIAALTGDLKEYADQVVGITVGSEHLYRKELTGQELADLIKKVQGEVKTLGLDTPVGFADSWNLMADGSANPAIKQSDIILANAFSYWQGSKITNSTQMLFDDIMQALQHVQDVKGTIDIPFWVGETNWPTGGKNFEDAVPNKDNAETYWYSAVCGMLGWGVNTFVFEAFDEPWKPAEKNNDVEQHWGVMTVDGEPKWDLVCPKPSN
ncbi:glycoside hydrolase superfamily [Tricharina praecox]|uniref:glycoside hydrolase superfamily n=1 Tax=Tricharina praecox TaxID=43433 RepID=UPI0022205D7E|nr:glycoside hydrolase superfamily [Tricharina praecox]KAI5850600.1 glycoside hydrolase superfamily [Tricharina praecox]